MVLKMTSLLLCIFTFVWILSAMRLTKIDNSFQFSTKHKIIISRMSEKFSKITFHWIAFKSLQFIEENEEKNWVKTIITNKRKYLLLFQILFLYEFNWR